MHRAHTIIENSFTRETWHCMPSFKRVVGFLHARCASVRPELHRVIRKCEFLGNV